MAMSVLAAVIGLVIGHVLPPLLLPGFLTRAPEHPLVALCGHVAGMMWP